MIQFSTSSVIIQAEISTAQHLETCRDLILNFYLPQVNITELFLPNVEELVKQFQARIKSSPIADIGTGQGDSDKGSAVLTIIQDPEFRRNMSTVDLELAVRYYSV